MENGEDWLAVSHLLSPFVPNSFFSTASLIILFLIRRLMELRDGTSSTVQTLSRSRCSLSSQQKAPGSAFLYWSIFFSISAVMTLGRPAFCAGSKFPVSWYLDSSLLMQPCVTLSCRLISHWRSPRHERLIMRDRSSRESGFPLTYVPPSWLRLPSPTSNTLQSHEWFFSPTTSYLCVACSDSQIETEK